jgi:AcrR family transcriptional regulator
VATDVPVKTKKGAATREHLYRTALSVIRKRGYERATMREIARAAGMSLGAAYHYFRSKDAIVMAYYEETEASHERAARAALEGARSFAERLDALFQTKLDGAVGDRKLLGVLFRSVGEPGHPLSPFSRRTARIRRANIALFETVLAHERSDVRASAGRTLWLIQLGLLLALLYDDSRGQQHTRTLARELAHGIAGLWPVITSQAGKPILAMLERLFVT